MSDFKMPILQPIPIKTKGLPWWEAISTWMTESRKWRVAEDWFFVLPDGVSICIPGGFIFDGASIPRFLWWLLSPIGLLLIPGLIHDYGYKNRRLECSATRALHLIPLYQWSYREYWDELFCQIAIQVNGFKIINYAAWIALRLFGWVAWNKHRKREK